jgi:hypothetical protein
MFLINIKLINIEIIGVKNNVDVLKIIGLSDKIYPVPNN